MPLYKTIKDSDGLYIAVWKISENKDELSHLLISEQLRDVQAGHLRESRTIERCAVRALLFEMTGKHLRIDYEKDGKPFLHDADYNISISHTKGFAAIALHPNRQPGVDIEFLSERILKIRSHVFSAEEMQQVSIEHERKGGALLSTIYWCAKETAFKIIGKPVYNFKQTLHIQPFIHQEKGELTLRIQTNSTSYLQIFYEICPDFILTWSIL